MAVVEARVDGGMVVPAISLDPAPDAAITRSSATSYGPHHTSSAHLDLPWTFSIGSPYGVAGGLVGLNLRVDRFINNSVFLAVSTMKKEFRDYEKQKF